MNMRAASYSRKRASMKAGDLIVFSGRGWISKLIKLSTWSNVSHVGVIRKVDNDGRVEVMESTSLNGISGVQVNRLSRRVAEYRGHIWWLPLNVVAREGFDEVAFWEFLWAQDGKPYDFVQAFKAGTLFRTRQNREAQFCSELVTGAFKESNILDKDINESEQTPIDVCRFPIYQDTYYQLKRYKGKRKEINF